MSDRRFLSLLDKLELESMVQHSSHKGDYAVAGPYREQARHKARTLETPQEKSSRQKFYKVHRMIDCGEFVPMNPDEVFRMHQEYFLTSKQEHRRSWELLELGRTVLTPQQEEDQELKARRDYEAEGSDTGSSTHGSDLSSIFSSSKNSAASPMEEAPASGGLKRMVRKGALTGALSMFIDGRHSASDEVQSTHTRSTEGSMTMDSHLLQQRGFILEGSSEENSTVPIPMDGAEVDMAEEDVGDKDELKPLFAEKQAALYNVPLVQRSTLPPPYNSADYRHAWYKICEMQVLLLRHYLTCAQVAVLARHFPKVDYLRVIAIQSLWGRIADLENFHLIMDELSEAEEFELLWRLGPLNCYNPKHPNRYFDLDLCSREDREVAKMLVQLAVEEPGENWVGEEYRWSHMQRPVVGWELPLSWTTPDDKKNGGPRRFGRLTLRYSSDPRKGCQAKKSLREKLTKSVLVGTELLE
ncbi:unnamed protein product [Chrysoparadoxa australica]